MLLVSQMLQISSYACAVTADWSNLASLVTWAQSFASSLVSLAHKAHSYLVMRSIG